MRDRLSRLGALHDGQSLSLRRCTYAASGVNSPCQDTRVSHAVCSGTHHGLSTSPRQTIKPPQMYCRRSLHGVVTCRQLTLPARGCCAAESLCDGQQAASRPPPQRVARHRGGSRPPSLGRRWHWHWQPPHYPR